jgi:hypothetical protein
MADGWTGEDEYGYRERKMIDRPWTVGRVVLQVAINLPPQTTPSQPYQLSSSPVHFSPTSSPHVNSLIALPTSLHLPRRLPRTHHSFSYCALYEHTTTRIRSTGAQNHAREARPVHHGRCTLILHLVTTVFIVPDSTRPATATPSHRCNHHRHRIWPFPVVHKRTCKCPCPLGVLCLMRLYIRAHKRAFSVIHERP